MRGCQGDPGRLDLKTSRPESGKWEKPIRQEPGDLGENSRNKPPFMSRHYASMGLDVGLRACVLPTGKFPPLNPSKRKLQVGQLDSRTGLGCLTPPPMNRHRSTRKARKKCRKMPNPVKIVEPMKQRTWNTKTGRKCQSPHKNGESNGWRQSDRAALCMTLPPPKKNKG